VFNEYVLPQIMAGNKTDWDNLSNEGAEQVGSIDECRARCEAQPSCKQYSFMQASMQSGWLEDRVLDFAHNMPACGDEGWQVGAATRHTRCS
jgi:hypothetical protein